MQGRAAPLSELLRGLAVEAADSGPLRRHGAGEERSQAPQRGDEGFLRLITVWSASTSVRADTSGLDRSRRAELPEPAAPFPLTSSAALASLRNATSLAALFSSASDVFRPTQRLSTSAAVGMLHNISSLHFPLISPQGRPRVRRFLCLNVRAFLTSCISSRGGDAEISTHCFRNDPAARRRLAPPKH